MIDFTKIKKLTIGGVELKQLLINGIQVWKAISFTNQVPISTDTDGSVFNKVGYKENVRLSSSGGISSSTQTGSVTTGFIPWKGEGSVLRLKGVTWLNAGPEYNGHYYMHFYNANKQIVYEGIFLYSGDIEKFSHVVTVTRDANGVESFVWNWEYGTANALLNAARNASFIRINAYGKGADMIVTINEDIE